MSQVADLLRQIYEHPADDELRLVLADALMATGDPRGEFIQLQIQPAHDLARRAMRLIQQHGLTWLGRLRGKVVPIGYDRGFLAHCHVYDESGVTGLDEWATVHTIELGEVTGEFVLDPVMRSLRRLDQIGPQLVQRVIEATTDLPRRVEQLGYRGGDWIGDLPARYRQLDRLPALRAVHGDGVRIERGPDGRLSTLSIAFGPFPEEPAMFEPWLRTFPADAFSRLVVMNLSGERMAAIRELAPRVQLRLRPANIVRRGVDAND